MLETLENPQEIENRRRAESATTDHALIATLTENFETAVNDLYRNGEDEKDDDE